MFSVRFLGCIALSLLAVKTIAGGTRGSNHDLKDGSYFEGDILTPCEQIESEYGEKTAKKAKKKGLCFDGGDGEKNSSDDRDLALRPGNIWRYRKNGKGQIPYKFERNDFTSTQQRYIRKQLDSIEEETNVVQFVERTNERSYIIIEATDNCSSDVGEMPSHIQPQRLSIDPAYGCLQAGVIQHEFLHALGFWHEQSRNDRDKYIKVLYDNVIKGKEYNFNVRQGSESLNTVYDYKSLMHYPSDAFSRNGRPTIDSKGHRVGELRGMSQADILQTRLMYQCDSGPRNLNKYNWYPCTDDCQCWKGRSGCNGNDNACQGDLICSQNVCTSGYRKPEPDVSDESSDMTSEERRKEKDRKREERREQKRLERLRRREQKKKEREERRRKEKEERKKNKGKV